MTLQSESRLAGMVTDATDIAEALRLALVATYEQLYQAHYEVAVTPTCREQVIDALKREHDFHEAHFGPSRERDLALYDLTGERDYRDRWLEGG